MTAPQPREEDATAEESRVDDFALLIPYPFADRSLLALALTHRSSRLPHNERLEFLGDAVLDLVISRVLYERFPGALEGSLSAMRASLVNTHALARISDQLGMGRHLTMGRGEDISGGRHKPALLAGALEALLGAVYLDGGVQAAEQMIHHLFAKAWEELDPDEPGKDIKSLLQERLQGDGLGTPDYEVMETSGPPHERVFLVECRAPGLSPQRGEGRSIREAERSAAKALWRCLKESTT